MRIAALDVGSNSFHLMVVQVTPNGRFETLDRAKEMVRLARVRCGRGSFPRMSFAAASTRWAR
jgi:exopolyphosphatase/guanosine-5'-triphosphate,3'-diphosphate pyrophosphatase